MVRKAHTLRAINELVNPAHFQAETSLNVLIKFHMASVFSLFTSFVKDNIV